MESQNNQTLSKFEIIGSTYINILYNNIYNNSILSNVNIKNAYIANILDYLNSSKEEEFFIQSINCICSYFKSSTKYTDLSFNNCVELLIIEFVPTNYINKLNKQQKHKILHNVLHNTLKRVIATIIKNHIMVIIDNHNDLNNLVTLQDIYLKNILYEKNLLLSRFADPTQKDDNTEKIKIFELLEKFKIEVVTLKKKNEELMSLIKDSTNKFNKLKNDYTMCLDNNKSIQSKLYKANLEIEQLNAHIKNVVKIKERSKSGTKTQLTIDEVIIEDDDIQDDIQEEDVIQEDIQEEDVIQEEDIQEEDVIQEDVQECVKDEYDNKSFDLNYDSDRDETNMFDNNNIGRILKKNNNLLSNINFDESVIINKYNDDEDDCLLINNHLDKLKTNKINESLLFN